LIVSSRSNLCMSLLLRGVYKETPPFIVHIPLTKGHLLLKTPYALVVKSALYRAEAHDQEALRIRSLKVSDQEEIQSTILRDGS